ANQFDVGDLFSCFTGLHHLVKFDDARVGTLSVEEGFKRSRVLASNAFLYWSVNAFSWSAVAAVTEKPSMTSNKANELEILVKTVMRGSVFARVCEAQANSPQKIFAEAHPTRYSTVSKIYGGGL